MSACYCGLWRVWVTGVLAADTLSHPARPTLCSLPFKILHIPLTDMNHCLGCSVKLISWNVSAFSLLLCAERKGELKKKKNKQAETVQQKKSTHCFSKLETLKQLPDWHCFPLLELNLGLGLIFLSFWITAASQGTQIKGVSRSSSAGDLILMRPAITWNDSIANPLLPQSSRWIRLTRTCWTDSKKNLIWRRARLLCNSDAAELFVSWR